MTTTTGRAVTGQSACVWCGTPTGPAPPGGQHTECDACIDAPRGMRHLTFPAGPLIALIDDPQQIADVVCERTWWRWKKDPGTRISDLTADRVATTLGRHPADIWDTWHDLSDEIRLF